MAWTNLTFNFGSLLTSTKMTQLDANFDSLAAGESGAPDILTTALLANPANSSGSETIPNASEWIPSAGIYLIGDALITFKVFVSGGWRGGAGAGDICSGIFFCDGTNMKFYNDSGSSSTLYYLKW